MNHTRPLLASTALALALAFGPATASPQPSGMPPPPLPTDPAVPTVLGEPTIPGEPTEPGDGAMPTEPRAPGATPMPAGQTSTPDYVNGAAAADMFEIEASKIAAARSQNGEIRAFAEMMIAEHTASSARLSEAAQSAGVSVPSALDDMHRSKLETLNAADDAGFDALYIDQQVAAHDAALALHRDYAAGGPDAALKAIATEMVPKVEAHAEQARRLNDALDGAASN